MKHRLAKSGNESVTRCTQLKLVASDGKRYLERVPMRHDEKYLLINHGFAGLTQQVE